MPMKAFSPSVVKITIILLMVATTPIQRKGPASQPVRAVCKLLGSVSRRGNPETSTSIADVNGIRIIVAA